MEGQLELERQCSGHQYWRQQSQPVEGEAERRVGVREDDRGVEHGVLERFRSQGRETG